MKWIIHIGYPKSASSTIQAYLRASDEIFLCGKKGGQYEGENGRYIVRNVLARAHHRSVPFDLINRWRRDVEDTAKRQGFSEVVMSDEIFLSMQMDSPPADRIATLHAVFGDDLDLRIVFRNHWSLLKSGFRQQIKVGSPWDFETYCFLALINRYSGILSNTDFSALLSYCNDANITHRSYLFERLIGEADALPNMLSDFGISQLPAQPKKANVSPTDEKLAWLHSQNQSDYKTQMHFLGWRKAKPGVHEIDRKNVADMAAQYGLESPVLNKWLEDVQQHIVKRQNRIKNVEVESEPISYDLPTTIKEGLEDVFRENCKHFNKLIGQPCEPYGYSV